MFSYLLQDHKFADCYIAVAKCCLNKQRFDHLKKIVRKLRYCRRNSITLSRHHKNRCYQWVSLILWDYPFILTCGCVENSSKYFIFSYTQTLLGTLFCIKQYENTAFPTRPFSRQLRRKQGLGSILLAPRRKQRLGSISLAACQHLEPRPLVVAVRVV